MVDLSDPDTYTNGFPHAAFHRLKSTTPVSWQAEIGGRGFWAVTRYADVVAVLRAPQIYSSHRGGVLLNDPPPEFLARLRESMMNSDPPDHTWLRRLVNKALNPRRIALLDGRVAEHAREIVARVGARGRCDFATDVAESMPLFMISEILGVPGEDRHALYGLTQRMFNTEIVDPAEAMRDKMAAAGEMRRYGAELGRRKTAAPADDLTSELVTADPDGRKISEGEFQAFFMLLFNAGTDTTRSILCYGLDVLLHHTEVMQRLREHPEDLSKAIEEILRFEPPVIQIRRTATQAVELAGAKIAEDDKVVVFFPSANRDATVFAEPDRFDIERTPNDHLAFGFGTHHCLGAPLARLESKHVFREVLAQLQGLERDGAMVPVRTNFVRGIRHLPIRFTIS